MKKLSQIYLIIGLILGVSCQNSVDTIADSKWKVYSLSPFIYNFSLDQKPNFNFLDNHFNFDTVDFKSFDSLFNKKDFKYFLNDTAIIIPYEENVNGQKVCCKYDTVNYLIDTLDNKTVFFLDEYSTMLVSDKKLDIKIKKRPEIIIPSWDVNLGEFLNQSKILDSLQINNYYYINQSSTTFTQRLRSNLDVELKTLLFEGDDKRLVFEVNNKLSKSEVDSFIEYFEKKYPEMKIKTVYDEDKTPTYFFNKYGYYFYIFSSSAGKEYEKNYHISISDNLKTIKNVYANKKKKYRLIEYYYLSK
ncbi:MAG: hypothetical protein RI991_844 [Bacteroidota bacterium]|jgi:hypothetical protein